MNLYNETKLLFLSFSMIVVVVFLISFIVLFRWTLQTGEFQVLLERTKESFKYVLFHYYLLIMKIFKMKLNDCEVKTLNFKELDPNEVIIKIEKFIKRYLNIILVGSLICLLISFTTISSIKRNNNVENIEIKK